MAPNLLFAVQVCFWLSVFLFVYTYGLFPLFTLLFSLTKPKIVETVGHFPSVCIVVAAYNEEEVIEEKIRNLRTQKYPQEKVRIIVASDGSDDATEAIVERLAQVDVQLTLLKLPRKGKNIAINAAIAVAQNELVVFTDADSMLRPNSLAFLVAPFANPEIGGVGGDYHYDSEAGNEGERLYWNLDRRLKQAQSRIGNMTSASGQLYAVRRNLTTIVPSNVTDDAFLSRHVIAQHRRLVFAYKARVVGPIASISGEYKRKVRIAARGLNGVWLQRQLLNPFNYGLYAVQLFSHKVLRRLMLLPTLLLLVTSFLLIQVSSFYTICLVAQLAFHALATLGILLKDRALKWLKPLRFAYYFNMVNAASLVGLWQLMRGKSPSIWTAQRVAEVEQV